MKISKKTHYGLQACFYLAKVYPEGSISAKELEKKINVSSKYLERIMRELSLIGVVSAKKGILGGYFLAESPDKISVGQIVRALEDDLEIFDCVKREGCDKCPSAAVWRKLYKGINDLLDEITLEQMIAKE